MTNETVVLVQNDITKAKLIYETRVLQPKNHHKWTKTL